MAFASGFPQVGVPDARIPPLIFTAPRPRGWSRRRGGVLGGSLIQRTLPSQVASYRGVASVGRVMLRC